MINMSADETAERSSITLDGTVSPSSSGLKCGSAESPVYDAIVHHGGNKREYADRIAPLDEALRKLPQIVRTRILDVPNVRTQPRRPTNVDSPNPALSALAVVTC